jgi:hypothetical protein
MSGNQKMECKRKKGLQQKLVGRDNQKVVFQRSVCRWELHLTKLPKNEPDDVFGAIF